MSTYATPLSDPLASPPRPKHWFQRHWLLSLLGGVALLGILVAAFVAVILTVIEASFKKSEAYTYAIAQARSNPHVIGKFGQPLEPGWFISGNIQVSGPSGNANLAIPITGPKTKGTIYVVAKKVTGRWRFETLEVEAEGESQRINLLAEPIPAS